MMLCEKTGLLFSDGGDYTSSIDLVNTSSTTQRGVIRFWNNDGSAANIEASPGTASSFNYSIPPNGVSILESHGQAAVLKKVGVEIAPGPGSTTPMGLSTARLLHNGKVISEYAAIAAAPKGHVTMYADLTTGHDASVVIFNPNNSPVTFNTRLWTLSNEQLNFTQRTLAPLDQIALSVNDVSPGVPAGFRGSYRLSVYPT